MIDDESDYDDDNAFRGYPAHFRRRFERFHRENPHVFRKFKELAFAMRATGRTRYAARTIIEKLRWEYDIKTTGEVFKINDNHIAMYARLLIHRYPQFEGFFELRVVRSRGWRSDEERERLGL
jgi:hypothetical protein